MDCVRNYFKGWSAKEIAWLVFVLLLQIAAWHFSDETTAFMLVLTVSNCLNLVLGAKGKIEGLYFAILYSLLYAFHCFGIKLYGEVMYNILYSIPCSAAGIIMWRKNSASTGEVKFRTMSPALIAATVAVTAVGTWGYEMVLRHMGGSFTFMDSLTTVVAVIASLLYILRYSEQWLMWVIVNALTLLMWEDIRSAGADASAFLLVVMTAVCLLTSLYGYLNWRKISKRVNADNA